MFMALETVSGRISRTLNYLNAAFFQDKQMLIVHTKAAVWGYDLSVEQYKNASFTLPTFDISLVNSADKKETHIFQLANYALNFKDGWKDFRYNST